MIRGYLQ